MKLQFQKPSNIYTNSKNNNSNSLSKNNNNYNKNNGNDNDYDSGNSIKREFTVTSLPTFLTPRFINCRVYFVLKKKRKKKRPIYCNFEGCFCSRTKCISPIFNNCTIYQVRREFRDNS